MDERIEQMIRVMEVLYEKGVSFADSLDVLAAFYDKPRPDRLVPAERGEQP